MQPRGVSLHPSNHEINKRVFFKENSDKLAAVFIISYGYDVTLFLTFLRPGCTFLI